MYFRIGNNKVGEIKKLSNLVSPEIGITAIENSHLEGLKTLENSKSKSELLENIEKAGCFIVLRHKF